MKLLGLAMLLFSAMGTHGQDATRAFLKSKNGRLHYVIAEDTTAVLFTLGYYHDPAGEGYSITSIDTLQRRSAHSFIGRFAEVTTLEHKPYLIKLSKKPKKLQLDTVTDLRSINRHLNNGYFLDNYFRMSDELNSNYRLNYHSFREGFDAWEKLDYKEVEYATFVDQAHRRLRHIRDSIEAQQDRYVAIKDYLIQNLTTLDYPTFRDSLVKLPAEYRARSWYYGTVVAKLAQHKPEYLLRLAEEFPHEEGLIFLIALEDETITNGLMAVEGHDAIKKRFLKERRFEKTFIFRALMTPVLTVGLVVWLVVANNN